MICMLMHLLGHRQTAAQAPQGMPWADSETARDILDRRYASGEIKREQYEELKRTLDRSRGTK